jgi:hypothetical protein
MRWCCFVKYQVRGTERREDMCRIAGLKAGQNSKPCRDFKCEHNFFWNKSNIFSPSKETEDTIKVNNCMCLLNEEMTLDQIGEIFGLTRERVRQIEENAIRKVCAAILSHKKDNFSEHFSGRELMLILKKKVELDKKKKKKKENNKKYIKKGGGNESI